MNEVITVKIKDQVLDLDKKMIKGAIDFNIDLVQLTESSHYHGRASLQDMILKKMESSITSKYLEAMEDEIVKKIDLDTLVKRVQLKIVDRISK